MDILSKVDMAAVKNIFNQFDADGTNSISLKELGKCLNCIGLNPTKQEVKDVMDDNDRDDDKSLNFDEFVNCLSKLWKDPETQESEMREAFQTFDKDGSETLTAEELRNLLTSLGDPFSEEEADEFLAEADSNGDGEINYGELISKIKSNGVPQEQTQDGICDDVLERVPSTPGLF